MKPVRERINIYMSLVARVSINSVLAVENENVLVYLRRFVLASYTADMCEV